MTTDNSLPLIFKFKDLVLESGETLKEVELAYETFGELNKDKTNAILICHALTGDSHVSGGYLGQADGWWENMVGPGKAFDTDKYFIICSNVIGGCSGSTGPSSINPDTGKPYALDFPAISIGDMVLAQKRLIDYLEIETLLTVAGGSMGGMQALAWVVLYPDLLKSVIPIATAGRHSPQQIALGEVGRQAVMSDPVWNQGNYYGKDVPAKGLSLARMIAHITYMSDESMISKFGRKMKSAKESLTFAPNFEVEGYLKYRGESFVKRFDANSYLYITKALDYFDIFGDDQVKTIFEGIDAKFLVIAFQSDWLYPSYQSQEIVKACKYAGVGVTYCEIESSYGHDAFLLEAKEETHLIKNFLKGIKIK